MATAPVKEGTSWLTRTRIIRGAVGSLLALTLLVGGYYGYRWWSTPTAYSLDASRGPATPINIALDGHCPVTLSTEMRWAPGHVAWNAVYDGQLYLFASQRHQQVFLINPASFGPAIAGVDAVEMASGRPTRGNRQFGVNHGGRVYLFASEQNLAQFSRSPDQYLQALQSGQAKQAEQMAGRIDLQPTFR